MIVKKLRYLKLFEELKDEDFSKTNDILQEIEDAYTEIFQVLKPKLKAEMQAGKDGEMSRYFRNLLGNLMVDLKSPPLDTIHSRRKEGLIETIQELINKI